MTKCAISDVIRWLYLICLILLPGCSFFKPQPPLFVLTYREVTLSKQQPSDADFNVKLIKVEQDGTVELQVLSTGERASAHPGATFEFQSPDNYGIQLVSSSAEKDEAVLTRNKCVHAK